MYDLSYHHADEIFRKHSHGLWLGDCSAADDIQWLKKNHIRTVITAASGFALHYNEHDFIRHITYELQDNKSQNIFRYFDKASAQIDHSLRFGNVLVHCGAGVSRSATLVIAYLIRYHGMRFATALKLCKAKRAQVCPNLGFELQLKSYDKLVHGTRNSFAVAGKAVKDASEQNILRPLVKLQNTKNNISYFNSSDVLTKTNTSAMHRSLLPGLPQKTAAIYLRKIAQFRFGVTNMQRWRIGESKPKRSPIS